MAETFYVANAATGSWRPVTRQKTWVYNTNAGAGTVGWRQPRAMWVMKWTEVVPKTIPPTYTMEWVTISDGTIPPIANPPSNVTMTRGTGDRFGPWSGYVSWLNNSPHDNVVVIFLRSDTSDPNGRWDEVDRKILPSGSTFVYGSADIYDRYTYGKAYVYATNVQGGSSPLAESPVFYFS